MFGKPGIDGKPGLIQKLLLCSGLLLLAGCAAISPTPSETWIDVRTAEEYAAGHVPQAINIPYEEIGDRIGELQLAPDQPIYLYCKSGRRAGVAKDTLMQSGYTRVINLGGLEDAQQYDKKRPLQP